MKRQLTSLLTAFLLTATASLNADGSWLAPSGVALSADGQNLYSIEASSYQVRAMPASLADPGKTLVLPDRPNALLLQPDGLLMIAAGESDGTLHIVAPDLSAISQTFSVGHTPSALALSPDKQRLFIANRFDDNVAVLNVASGKVEKTIPVLREPVSLAIASGKLWVANLLPLGRADTGDTYSEVSVIDINTLEKASTVKLPNGTTSLGNLTASPDGKYVYATHILARYQVPTTQLDRGWMNTNAMSVIDASEKKLVNTVLLDEPHLGAANPGAVAVTPDGKSIAIAIEGTHEIMLIDRERLHKNLTLAAEGKPHRETIDSARQVPFDLSFLSGYRERIRLPGNGPRGIAVDNGHAYTAMRYTDQINRLDMQSALPQTLELNPELNMSAEEVGEAAFHDATYCFQKWQSCASCHPGQGRVDALNWDLLNDGIGNPKQTKSLLLAHATPPVMISGVRGDYTVANRAGFRHIQFVIPPEERVQAVDAYVAALEPVPSPRLENGELSAAALRGKAIFEKAQCSRCHSAPYFTDLKSYDVGTGGLTGNDNTPLDTPTLIEVWRTAPYLKDGRAATIEDVLTTFNPDDMHGRTSNLSESEVADLAEYVLSL